MWFIGVEVEQETSAPPPKKNPGSANCDHPILLDCTTSHLRLLTKHSSHCKQRLVLLWHYELASLDDELVSAKRLKAQCFDAL